MFHNITRLLYFSLNKCRLGEHKRRDFFQKHLKIVGIIIKFKTLTSVHQQRETKIAQCSRKGLRKKKKQKKCDASQL